MSKGFLRELGAAGAGSRSRRRIGSHAVQTAKVMIGFEEVCLAEKPDLVVVVGDVNSTMAATLVAAKLLHSGRPRRSRPAQRRPHDAGRDQPLVTDRLADLLLTPSADADENLRAEGVAPAEDSSGRQHHDRHADAACCRWRRSIGCGRRLDLKKGGYAVLTLHRPSNVDNAETFRRILEAVQQIAARPADGVSGPPAHARARRASSASSAASTA